MLKAKVKYLQYFTNVCVVGVKTYNRLVNIFCSSTIQIFFNQYVYVAWHISLITLYEWTPYLLDPGWFPDIIPDMQQNNPITELC